MKLDNLIASHKAALDGIAMAMGVDDSRFRIMAVMGAIRKPAAVVITLAPSEVAIEFRGGYRDPGSDIETNGHGSADAKDHHATDGAG